MGLFYTIYSKFSVATKGQKTNLHQENHSKNKKFRYKSPYFRTSSFLNMAVRGGLTRCARPSGPEQALFKNAPGVFVSNPGRVFSSPLGLGDTYKQKARTSVQALNLNMAVRGGLTRFARPFGAARSLCARSVQLAAPVVEPRSVVLIPP